MHPLLVATYFLNLILLNAVFGIIGLFAGMLGSYGIYYLISNNKGDKRKHIGQVMAMGWGHLLGVFAVAFAPWGSEIYTGVAIIMELFIFAIFSNLGKL